MDLALDVSYRKAYTAMTFTSPTSALEDRFTGPFSVGKVENVLLSAGGVPIQASGETLGALVSVVHRPVKRMKAVPTRALPRSRWTWKWPISDGELLVEPLCSYET